MPLLAAAVPACGSDTPDAQPMPAAPAPRRLFDATASLTGSGSSACAHQPPAPGQDKQDKQDRDDRWCAFMKPGANSASTELWVVNVTRAAVGPVPPCDGSSPQCLRLTSNLWTSPAVVGGPVHPLAHRFHGDTLLYYADAVSPSGQLHRGPVYAWRPGWSQPRRISSANAIQCWAHEGVGAGTGNRPLAYCLDDLTGDPMHPTTLELRAGPIADAEVTLPSLGQLRAYDSSNAPALQATFSPGGELFVFSSPDPDPAVETLRVIATADLGKAAPREVLRDASSWEITRSDRGIYFYRLEAPEQRALYFADFPSGAHVTKLASKVQSYLVLGQGARDDGVVFLTELDAARTGLRLLRDPLMPAGATTVFSLSSDMDMLEGVELSPDGRFTAWSDAGFNLRVVRHSDLQSCDLNTTGRHDAFAPAYLASAGLVFWKEDAEENGMRTDRLDGWYADPDGCRGKQRFATGLNFLIPVADRALVYGDEYDDQAFTVTLKYAVLTAGKGWPAGGPVRIRGGVDDSSVFLIGDNPALLLFRVRAGGPDQEGTYVFGPAPF